MDALVYKNGNYLVLIVHSGIEKRRLRKDEELQPEFPDIIDLKLSNYCPTNYCYKSNKKDGKLAKFDDIQLHLNDLPKVPLEIFIDGGNIFEDAPSWNLLNKTLTWCTERNYRIRLNIDESAITEDNLKRLDVFNEKGLRLNIDLGPEMKKERFDKLIEILEGFGYGFSRRGVIFNIILGLFPLDLLQNLVDKFGSSFFYPYYSITFLGYSLSEANLPKDVIINQGKIINESLTKIKSGELNTTLYFGFDNLALEQLNLEKTFLRDEFENVYFKSCDIFVDAVEGEYARTPMDIERMKWNKTGLLDFFKHDKNTRKTKESI